MSRKSKSNRRSKFRKQLKKFTRSRRLGCQQLEAREMLDGSMPNIVLINTDDQRWDSVEFMPTVMSQLVASGTDFTNSFVTTPICCPSRATLLTGQYAHTSGVIHNDAPLGAFQNFDDTSTLATWLDDAGYFTALVGKYMNGYDRFSEANSDSSDVYIPPGWDEWRAFLGAGYGNYTLANNSVAETYGNTEADYSTDVLADIADNIIRDAEANDEDPFFLYFAPKNPHVPVAPAARHAGTLDGIALHRPPSFNEADISDKPTWAQNKLPLLTQTEIDEVDAFRQGSIESMLSVDEAVSQMIATLTEMGELDNTIIIYTSDNGHMWGEHRFDEKATPWEESIRVPLIVYDGRNPVQQTNDAMALNMDLASTILELAMVTTPSSVEGSSLVPFLNGETTSTVSWRSDFLIEAEKSLGGEYNGVRTEQYMYAEYTNGTAELYDIVADPYQLENLAENPAYATIRTQLSTRIAELMSPDTEAPVMSNLQVVPGALSNPATFTATITDTGVDSGARSPEFFIDTIGNFSSGSIMHPVDGLYDSSTEDVTVTIDRAVWNALSVGTHTFYVHGIDKAGNWGEIISIEFEKLDVPPPTVEYDSMLLAMETAGTIAGSVGSAVTYEPGDILQLNFLANGDYSYELYFDGSDVGLTGGEAINALHVTDAGEIIISTSGGATVDTVYSSPGVGNGTPLVSTQNDLLMFTPTSIGDDTAGSWSLLFDGSEHGLDGNTEDIDAVFVMDDGRIAMSFVGGASVPGQVALDKDALLFDPANDLWTFYFNGSDLDYTTQAEDIDAMFIGPNAPGGVATFYTSTVGAFVSPEVTAEASDVVSLLVDQFGVLTQGQILSELQVDADSYGLAGLNVVGMHFLLAGSGDVFGPQASMVEVDPSIATEGPLDITATLDDSLTGASAIVAAEYFIDTLGAEGTGTAMTAEDGTFDSAVEAVTGVIAAGTFDGLATGTHTVYVRGQDASGNWGLVGSVDFIKQEVGVAQTIYRVNAGGSSITDVPDWEADTDVTPSAYLSGTSSNTRVTSGTPTIDMTDPSIPAGTPVEVFQSDRFDLAGGGEMGYDFPVTPGMYEVRLYFAETWTGGQTVGAREFDVQIEGVTVLDDYDIYEDIGGFKGVVKTFMVTADATLDIDFFHVTQNPSIRGIEILTDGSMTGSMLGTSQSSVDFGNVTIGETGNQVVQFTNNNLPGGDDITIDPSAVTIAAPFAVDFGQATPIVLAPGQSVNATVSYTPTAEMADSDTLTIPHTGDNTPLVVALSGMGTVMTTSNVLYRVNAGGASITDTPDWGVDTAASPSPYLGGTSSNTRASSSAATIDMSDPSVPAGTPMNVFQTERYDLGGGGEMSYDFPVAPGEYEVRLYFSENWTGGQAADVRKFDVAIEGVTVLDDYDVYADVGGFKGVVKTFTVVADANIDIDFFHVMQHPSIKGIEILSPDGMSSSNVSASLSTLSFGTLATGSHFTLSTILTNDGTSTTTIDPAQASLGAGGAPFSFSFADTNPIQLAPGESTRVMVTFSPTTETNESSELTIPYGSGSDSLSITLGGLGAAASTVNFTKSELDHSTGPVRPTVVQFGPDGRLYVAQQFGVIRAYDVVRNGANDYATTSHEQINLIRDILNHNDQGDPEPGVGNRLVTGMYVTGTAENPVIYVASSDPRIGGGTNHEATNLDTNSGIVSRLTWNGSSWDKLDLVRGLPRSEENHGTNGLALDPVDNTLYLAVGGNTNMGAPSANFLNLPEYALSAAVLSIDLDAIGETTYDLPTLDDEDRAGVDDLNDPFGGNDGKNQARIVPGGPVQVYAPGFRNPYDVILTAGGRMYTVDNGPNAQWGDVPVNEGPGGNATNDTNEGGTTYGDGLHLITGEGYYGGHPNPTRSNTNNTFNTTNPQSPVTTGNPIESDYLVPVVEDGSLIAYPFSTNGMTEYTANNFGGAMKGDLLMAGFENTIERVKLNAAGDTVIGSETLFNNIGFKPLDIFAPTGEFEGTIWVVDVATNGIYVYEPADGNVGTEGDMDGDGYTDDDELAAGTNPNNSGDVPSDNDMDFVSDFTDDDDDNDLILDVDDEFAIDPDNGTTSPLGTFYSWENEGQSAGGILGLGFTGMMTNGVDDWLSLYNAEALTGGGAAGVLTIDAAGPGTARGATNTQDQAFQFGVDVSSAVQRYVATTSLLGPFAQMTPQAGQEMGFYIGTGDQDNYIQFVLSGDNGGELQVVKEVAGVDTVEATVPITISGLSVLNLYLSIDPLTNMLQASYEANGGERTAVGPEISVPASWVSGALATGLIATDPTASSVPVTWDFLGIIPDPAVLTDAEAAVVVNPGGGINNSSTFTSDSFQITNNSASGQTIQSIRFDLSTAFLPDIIFDTSGSAGDVGAAKSFTPDTGETETGQSTHTFSGDHDGGFDILDVMFNDFDPGETFTFSVDIDPTSIKGVAAPGPEQSGSISGLEMAGSTVTIQFSDGSTISRELFGIAGSNVASQVTVAGTAPDAPTLELLGVASVPTVLSSDSQVARITGPVGAMVRLLHVEGALHLDGVPGGGFDIDAFEANKAIAISEQTATIGATGFADIPVTLTDSHAEGGLNHLMAVIEETDGTTSDLSQVIVVEYDPDAPVGGEVLFRVNTGGTELADTPVWETDTNGTPSAYLNVGFNNAKISTNTVTIDMTDASIPAGTPMALLQTNRFDPTGGGDMMYDFPVTPGDYEVRLYFAETWSGAQSVGVREFDVAIEGATVLDDYDIFADIGGFKGVMKSFVVTADSNLDIDFTHVTQNPQINGIEIVSVGTTASSTLGASAAAVPFGNVATGGSSQQVVSLTNQGQTGANPIVIDPTTASIAPGGTPFTFDFGTTSPITLQPGQSVNVTVTYSPTAETTDSATLTILHDGTNPALTVALSGTGVDSVTEVLYRVNAGGPQLAADPVWSTDTTASPSANSNPATSNSKVATTGVTIDMTDPSIPADTPASVFQTERWDPGTGEEMQWDFSVTPGEYEVRLYFAETYSGAQSVDARVFDVAIEGVTLLDDYDVFADVGGNKGVVKTFTVTSDGNLDIDFGHVTQNPSIKGIEIIGNAPTGPQPINFSKSTLAGTTSTRPTSIEFGPDGRLYVAQQFGVIRIYDVVRNGADDYEVVSTETITSIRDIPNHDDDGSVNASINNRTVTGLIVRGTAQNPIIYVSSSDPRIAEGNPRPDTGLDTNSGIISRLTWNGSSWDKLDLVRGLPRSEGNHSVNGLALDDATNTLYVAVGGNTNMGAPSFGFALLPEYAYSAAILSVDLDAIGETTYDMPTLDDEDRAGTDDFNDPFGGNDGKNQAIIVPGGPVQVYAAGFRNPYDVQLHSSGRMYTFDNGSNANWGDIPIGEGPGGNATNQQNEPGISTPDQLHYVTGQGFYGGHPNPTRSNTSNTFNTTNPQSPVAAVGGNAQESDYLTPGTEDGALFLVDASTNGIDEYTTTHFGGQMQGDLIIASLDNTIKRVKLNAAGDQAEIAGTLFSNVGVAPLDVDVADSGPFAGSIWVVDLATNSIYVYEPTSGTSGNPNDLDGDGYTNDDEADNNTDPNNSADTPPDWDTDFVSNLNDPNDDNDAFLDTEDHFAIDASDGLNTPVGTFFTWDNDAPNPGGLLNLGFTGVMTNGVDDYGHLYFPGAVTAGGAAGLFTIDSATAGTARGATNTQEQALQFGVNAVGLNQPFYVTTTISNPFAGLTPQAGQQFGMFIGTGDQDNYVELVLAGDGGGAVQVISEVAGSDTLEASTALAMPGPDYVDLFLAIDPTTNMVQASIMVDGGSLMDIGGPISIPASWLASPLAVGVISTDPTGSGSLPVTWEHFGTVLGTPSTPANQAPMTSAVGLSPQSTTSGPITVTATADDSDGTIAAAEYFIDTVGAPGTGTAMSASDGSFDEASEAVTGTISASTFDGLSTGNHTVYVRAMDSDGAWSTVASATLSKEVEENVLLRINAGGPDISDNPVWEEDTDSDPHEYSNAGISGANSQELSTAATIDLSDPSIPAGTPMSVFQTSRFDNAGSLDLAYDLPLGVGMYEVRLYFAEIDPSAFAVGERVFDIEIEENLVENDFDIYAAAGAGNKGIVLSYIVSSSTELDLDFIAEVGNPMVSAIEVLPIGGGSGALAAFAATSESQEAPALATVVADEAFATEEALADDELLLLLAQSTEDEPFAATSTSSESSETEEADDVFAEYGLGSDL
ncbi:malectin domain-containing carbohydrate-binding protein [Aeoliella sp.]|uniref:malectin domain-containing carbohydrate-binding protein n=1 Tax=Aeoliella sp. TaxID=2795800 RepID=UPI003CCBD4AB